MQALSKGLIITGYLLFGLVAFLVFLYKTFPFGFLQETLVKRFEAQSGCRTDVGYQITQFPLIGIWGDIQIHCPSLPSLPIETFRTDIPLRPLLFEPAKEIPFHVQMPANMGEIVGRLTVQDTPEGTAFSLNNEGKKINLYPLGLMGTVSAQGNGNWIGNDLLGGVGSQTVTLEDLRIELLEQESPPSWVKAVSAIAPLTGITALSFSTVHGEIAWRDHILSLGKFYADGEIAEIRSGDGTITLNTPPAHSTLSMTFTVIPRGNLAQMAAFVVPHYSQETPLTFVITGMLSSPHVSMNGTQLPAFL